MPLEAIPTVCFIGEDGTSIPAFTTKIILAEISTTNRPDKKTVLYGCTTAPNHKTLFNQLWGKAHNLGLRIRALGGAFVRIEGAKNWAVYGFSESLGHCDKAEACRLLHQAFPNCFIRVSENLL